MVGIDTTATRPPEPVNQVAADRIFELTRTRDEGINAGTSYTFPDGRTGIIPMEVPDQVSRLTTLYVRAERAERLGQTKTFHITTNDDQDHDLSASEMAAMGDAATDAGQNWHVQWQKHRRAIQDIAADTSLTDDEKRQKIRDYDDENSNGGWPS